KALLSVSIPPQQRSSHQERSPDATSASSAAQMDRTRPAPLAHLPPRRDTKTTATRSPALKVTRPLPSPTNQEQKRPSASQPAQYPEKTRKAPSRFLREYLPTPAPAPRETP